MANIYILVDPFNEATSGVTTYIDSVESLSDQIGAIFKVVSREKDEDIDFFRKRVALFCRKYRSDNVWVEAPETLHTTKYVDISCAKLHIRLHGSRQLGAWLQKGRMNSEELDAEKIEVNRAHFISAPSVAAGLSSWHLYSKSKEINFYPNPVPSLVKASKEKIYPEVDVLFLGRWQRLKGIDFFLELIQRKCGLTFGVASAEVPHNLPKGVEFFDASNEDGRILAISKSKVVLIPSLFETASMVGLEAISLNRRVVCWEHLGLVEYFNEKIVFSAKAGNLLDLENSLRKAVEEFDLSNSFEKMVGKVNEEFVQGVKSILSGSLSSNLMPFSLRAVNFISDLELMRELGMSKDKKLIFKRKLRKLLRNPGQFLRDSHFFSSRFSKISPAELTKSSDDKISYAENSVLDKFEASGIDLEADLKDQFLIAEIDGTSRVALSAIPGSPAGWRTVIVYCKGDGERLDALREQLTSFVDFSPFKSEFLKHISLDLNSTDSVLSIINRIDVANKEKLSSISNFIFLDPPINAVAALRACGPYVRTIVVRTENSRNIDLTDISSVDALVTNVESDLTIASLGRINRFECIEDCAKILRKVVQEIGPKSPDMLLPLIECQRHSDEYINFDSRRYQGIIFLRKSKPVFFNTFEDYVDWLACNVAGMMVVESVYMKYRGLCEMIEAGNGPAELIKVCLFDGVLFDVREED